MGGGGPSFDDRLLALACLLAAAHDIAAVMSVRSEIVALIGESGGRPDNLDLQRRARDLRRQAETVVGGLLLLMAERSERRGNGGDQRTPAGRARASIASLLGFRWRTTPSRWQRRARSAPARSFNVRLAEARDIEAIKGLIDAATAEGRACLRVRDHVGHRIAIARRMAAKRAAGIMLLAGGDSAAVTPSSAQRWIRLARLNEHDFRAAVETANEDPGHKAARAPVHHQVIMQITPWIDQRGILSRKVYAVDDPALGGAATVTESGRAVSKKCKIQMFKCSNAIVAQVRPGTRRCEADCRRDPKPANEEPAVSPLRWHGHSH